MTQEIFTEEVPDNVPLDIIQAALQVDGDYLGYLPPDEQHLIAQAGETPIYEVKINSNIAVLQPGEAAISGAFVNCVAGIARVDDQILVMHMYPRANTFGDLKTSSFIAKLQDQGHINPQNEKLLDEILFIGRNPDMNAEEYEPYSRTTPKTLDISNRLNDEQKWNILVFNNPDTVGDINSHYIWTD